MDTTNITEFEKMDKGPACRVAYMIDNDQPVLCTLIGDQPLFYADDVGEEELEEESIFEETGDLLFKLTHQEMREQVTSYHQKREDFAKDYKIDAYDLFTKNVETITKPNVLDLGSILEVLNESRFASELYEFATSNSIEINISKKHSGVFYDRSAKGIFVHPGLSLESAIIGLSQELRRVWQHLNGMMINPLTFQPEDAITVNRVQIADLCISKVRIAWELKMAGYDKAWSLILSSASNDIAFTFEREVKADFRTLNSGWAMQLSFEKWFLSDRCKLEDKKLIQMMLADHGGHVFEDPQSSSIITMETVSRIGDMPYGKNYLSGFSGSIVSDPLYTEVRDRSSANFLWFVKFETAYRETERGLMKKENSDSINSSVRTTLFKDLEEEDNAKGNFGEILAFTGAYDGSERRKSESKKGQASKRSHRSGGEVIQLFERGNTQETII